MLPDAMIMEWTEFAVDIDPYKPGEQSDPKNKESMQKRRYFKYISEYICIFS